MNSGPMASTIVSERIRSISTMADASICQPDRPASGFELVRSPRAPKGDHRSLSVENPAQRKMDDAPSIIFLRKAVELFNCPQVLRKPRRPELRVTLSQVVAGELRLHRHAARQQPPA